MGSILAFPCERDDCGIIHAYPQGDGFEIGHESRSGDSWGSFEWFEDPCEAVVAAYALNRKYANACRVALHPGLLAALPDTPPPERGGF